MGISTRAPVPSPRLLEEISHFFRLLSEPARLQLQQLQESSLR